MIDGEFILDGYSFGTEDHDVWVQELDLGTRARVTADEHIAGTLGRLMGRDSEDAPEWTFDLRVRAEGQTLNALGRLRRTWQGPDTPGALSVLRYGLPGRQRRVYGRPRRFTPAGEAVRHAWHHGRAPVLATFQLADPRHFNDVAKSVTLSIVPASVGGLMAPLAAPLSTVRSSAPRAGFVTAAGDAPAPVAVTFRGPISDPFVRALGWEIGVAGHIAYDETVTVDALTTTALRSDGASVGGRLTRRTRLRDAALQPGQQEITFGGTDGTGTATATVTWRDAWWSL
ncbi:hypothetical protein SAMN05216184_10495 [Georgenia satyanarayanai]|uniref:Phage tail protein n=1 Tax=Georgenia satyanarayanai TaxID=860221 RepID=A0A2Y9C4Y2_9MICO|nr:hypothetical protein [Georgenia satyanarayanai]PYG00156.1 hypothetical protein A8987_10495 [Georgenia satyanarayanai]SSA40373.1 hypothetical protein SAMN05216184_10495 [Georgenia satyanarayanai]